jgi:hypothetical protein
VGSEVCLADGVDIEGLEESDFVVGLLEVDFLAMHLLLDRADGGLRSCGGHGRGVNGGNGKVVPSGTCVLWVDGVDVVGEEDVPPKNDVGGEGGEDVERGSDGERGGLGGEGDCQVGDAPSSHAGVVCGGEGGGAWSDGVVRWQV